MTDFHIRHLITSFINFNLSLGSNYKISFLF